MDVKTLALLVEETRKAQNEYFRSRTRESLEKSKRLEKTLDEAVKTILHPEDNSQQRLF